MSVSDLKTIMHQRIEHLQDEETVLDLFATMTSFLEGRSVPPDSNSPEIVARLKQSLASQESGNRGISTDELVTKMEQWRTR